MNKVNDTNKCVPVIKWVGGKRQLLEVIRKKMPEKFGTYFEPFFGGAHCFLTFILLLPLSMIIMNSW